MLQHQDLDRLVQFQEAAGASIQAFLRPGVPAEALHNQLSRLGLEPPDALVQLYAWSDGIERDARVFFFDDHFFLPLADALKEYQTCVKWSASWQFDFAPWFPFASFEGSNLFVYARPEPFRGHAHPILRMYHSLALVFASLETMVQTLLTWHQTQTYHQSYPHDGPKMHVWERLNPGFPIGIE